MLHKGWAGLAILAALLIALPSTSSAFDGDRGGFLLGFGLGLGSAKQTFEVKDSSGGADISVSADVSKGGLATDFKIGGGVNQQWWIYYHAQNIFFKDEEVDAAVSQDVTFVQGINGVGATYFLQPEAPSFFFDATLGAGFFVAFTEDESSGETGFGGQMGVGYEFSPHWAVHGSLMSALLEQESLGDATLEVRVTNALVAFTWTGY